MSVNKTDSTPSLTFVSTTGPTLDHDSAKAVRAHTTRANFARRRQRLVREYAVQKQKDHDTVVKSLQIEVDGSQKVGFESASVVELHPHFLVHPGLDRKPSGNDSFFINYLTHEMEKLHLDATVPASDAVLIMMKSDWACFLPEPTMFDVSLYFARLLYAARRQEHTQRLLVDAYKGRAIRAVRECLNQGLKALSDSLVAAILILTILDQTLGSIEAWKIHITGLVEIITLRSRKLNSPPSDLASLIVPRTVVQGLLLLSRYDLTLILMIEKTGVFDMMFSVTGRRAAYKILADAEEVTRWIIHDGNKAPFARKEQILLRRIIKSLDAAIEINSDSDSREAFLTAIALSLKIFLQMTLQHTMGRMTDLKSLAVQLMEVLQKPKQQLPSSLVLCATVESNFWYTTMGAIAASDSDVKSFYRSRLKRIADALALASWTDAERTLETFFWIPSIFSSLCRHILSEVMDWKECSDS
ncbi:hypothetical protein PV08_08509 [Exophiala spinifera]|uniref:Transcription factor domain-containing protein n=1 Tax=Exophiala spinifera TaxID=91928 RepID=A0A0D1YE11_9EURO|nr:uncharacterized protein PV08_08509 [Exophiala spinifera]KIW13321.1 hypothetical protein PV08_08509 [Exophiala spinifera]